MKLQESMGQHKMYSICDFENLDEEEKENKAEKQQNLSKTWPNISKIW